MKALPLVFRTSPWMICLLFSIQSAHSQQKIADTVYYNENWQICEQPIAAYYRVGVLAAVDDLWYYTGPIKDYNINHELLMEGEYAANGKKNGLFTFYFPNGKKESSGHYEMDKMFGRWHWYYPDEKERAEVYFTPVEQDFKFIRYIDENGVVQLDNGVGQFTWPCNININVKTNGYVVTGKFDQGKRKGKWDFNQASPDGNLVIFTEIYEDDGSYKKTRNNYAFGSNKKSPFPFQFSRERLTMIETIPYDRHFYFNGDSVSSQYLIDYVVNHKPVEIKTKHKIFDSVYIDMIRTLYKDVSYFDFVTKDIDADIEFRLGTNGFPDDITIKGTGFSSLERNLIIFLLQKFRNIELPASGAIAVEGYHHIYMYGLDLSDFYPPSMRSMRGREIFFSYMKKQKMLEMLNANKRDIKKFLFDKAMGY